MGAFGLFSLDVMIPAASLEGQEFEAKSPLEWSELELLGLVLVWWRHEREQEYLMTQNGAS